MLALLHTLCDRSALLHTSKTSSTHCAIEMFHICTVNIVRPKFMYFPNLRAATDRSKASQKSILAINLWDNQGRTIPPSWWTCSIVWWGRKSLRYQQERMKRKVHAEFRPWSWEGETKLQVQLPQLHTRYITFSVDEDKKYLGAGTRALCLSPSECSDLSLLCQRHSSSLLKYCSL